MLLRFLVGSLFLLTACGSEPSKLLLEPTPKQLEVGTSAHYVLDPQQSTQIVTSGDLNIDISERTETLTTFTAKADVQTKFGPQKVELTQAVANDVLTVDFLADLRDKKTFVGNGYSLRYESMTREGCDEVSVSDITQYPGVTLKPTICVASAQAPRLMVFVDLYGLPIRMAFKQAN